MKNPTFPALRAQADPQWKGKHPFHDFRFITTDHPLIYDPPFTEGDHDTGATFDHDDGKIIATMRDVLPDGNGADQRAFALLFAGAPELLAAALDVLAWFHRCHGAEMPVALRLEAAIKLSLEGRK